MSVPQPHGYSPAWPPQPGYPGGQPHPGPPRAPRSPITAVTGVALLLAAFSTAGHFFWNGGSYSFLTVIPALQVGSGLAAAVACFAARGGAARPAAGVAGGLLLVSNLSFLMLRLEHSRYYDFGSAGNWLTIPAALGALIAIVTVLLPTPEGRSATPSAPQGGPGYPNPGPPYSAAPAPAPAPAAPAWQQAAAPAYPANHAYPANPAGDAHPGAPGHPGGPNHFGSGHS